ncbi:hypothetical protein TNCV_2069671 [Trichonephila clavipes]|uniref:Uncharacterized protein n=1 Tax=Trichonephila clavipes TaxID=2585209 RepID=A0A8X7BEC0_TRICX|nr:hypothetical protein TNCV_2069671 [Trichonephila clavipes]
MQRINSKDEKLQQHEQSTKQMPNSYEMKKKWYWTRTRYKARHDPIPIPLGYHGRPNPAGSYPKNSVHYQGFPQHCSINTRSDSGTPNVTNGYRNTTPPAFPTSPGFA